jgi:nucleoside-diphosphate-sugar epimerase
MTGQKGLLILVTGGAGYVGATFIRDALARGYRVRCLDILIYGGKALVGFLSNPNFELTKGDVRVKKDVEKALENVDVVVHLAAVVGDLPCQVAPKSSFQINFKGTQLIADSAKQRKIRHFIFASTCSNYGVVNPETPANEKSKLNPVSLYAETKIDCENYLTSLQDDSFHTTCLRYGTAYGVSFRTRFDLLLNSFTYEALFEDELMVFGANTWRPYIHVADMSQILLKVLMADEDKVGNQIFNAGATSENYKKEDVVHMIEEALPSIKAHYSSSIDDVRNYKVDFTKIEQAIGYKPSLLVQNGIQELILCFRTGVLSKSDFESNNQESLKSFYKQQESTLARQ